MTVASPQWDQVSGILIFEPRFWSGGDEKSYIWALHPNPDARIPLSDEFIQLAGKTHSDNYKISHT